MTPRNLAWLLLVGVCGCSRPVPVDFVRLTDLWVDGDAQRIEVAPQASVGGVTRIGFPIRVGVPERIRLVIPQDGELSGFIAVVVEPGGGPPQERQLEITECERTGWGLGSERAVARVTANSKAWLSLHVSLSDWAGEEVALCFSARRPSAGNGNEASPAELWLAGATVAQRGVAPKAARQPNLILLSQIAQSSTAISGPPAGPNLARLAREGETFSAAMMNSASPGPARAALFSGLHPRELPTLANLGARKPGPGPAAVLPLRVRSLSELFWALGYRTAGIVSERALGSEFGFAQGFDSYDLRSAFAEPDRPHRPVAGVASITDRALSWLADAEGAFFLFLNYEAPEVHGESLDSGLGRLVAYLRTQELYDTTLIIVVSNRALDPLEATPGMSERNLRPLSDQRLGRVFTIKYARAIAPSRVGKRYDHRVDALDLRASIVRETGLRDEFERNRQGSDVSAPAGLYGLSEGRSYHFAEFHGAAQSLIPSHGEPKKDLEAVYFRGWELVRDKDGNHWLADLTDASHVGLNLSSRYPARVAKLDGVLDAWARGELRDAPVEDIGRFSIDLALAVAGGD